MPTDDIRRAEIERMLTLLYPDPPADAWLVISWPDTQGNFASHWFTLQQQSDVCPFLLQQSSTFNTYIGVGLRHPASQCSAYKRGDSAEVYALPGLWIECDHAQGAHAAKNLPTPFQLSGFLQSLPFTFSLLIDSTGGYHGYLLFKELWVLETPEERATAQLLLRRFQRTIQLFAAEKGWHIDTTADLARVLRPAGTFNHKSGHPLPVTIVDEQAIRYNPSDLLDAPWLVEIEDTYTPPSGGGSFPPSQLDLILDKCPFLRHCRDDAAALSEPEWYAMLTIVGRCEDGEQHAHALSQPYPRYSKEETTKKLAHALKDTGPFTCQRIRTERGGAPYCQGCKEWPRVKSPIALGVVDDGVRIAHPNGAGATSTRPVIKITTDMEDVARQAQDAIIALAQGPYVYQRARQLMHITQKAPEIKWLHRPPDLPTMAMMSRTALRALAATAAQWAKYDKRSKAWEEALPPAWAIDALCDSAGWAFPPLEGIIYSPTLRPDGSLLQRPGYDPETGLYLDYDPALYPPIADHPTHQDAIQARLRLEKVFVDFPFEAAHHRSAVLAAILSLVARYAIEGNVPLFAARSTTRGSGKGLLIDAISLIGTGRLAPRMAQTRDEDEERKRLFTVALAGLPTLHIDNVTMPLGSAPLDMALTTSSISDRLLGKNEQQEVPLNTVFFASGNNMQVKSDLARRLMPVDLAPAVEHPEERTQFAHQPLLPWIRQHRTTFVVDALTILRAYVCAGMPVQNIPPLGSYESWSTLVRQSLLWAGSADPCLGRANIEAESDPQYERAITLLTCWYTCYKSVANGLTLRQVIQDTTHFSAVAPKPPNEWDALRDALGAFDDRYDGKNVRQKQVGLALRAIKGRIINKMRLSGVADTHTKILTWRVEVVS
jgi:hypothetical protein